MFVFLSWILGRGCFSRKRHTGGDLERKSLGNGELSQLINESQHENKDLDFKGMGLVLNLYYNLNHILLW